MKNLITNYNIKKDEIKKRLDDFSNFYIEPLSWFYVDKKMVLKKVQNKTDNERIFEELSFCLLTANTSAVIGMKGVDKIRSVLIKGTYEQIQKGLVDAGYRFPNIRANYIVLAREKFQKDYNFEFKKLIESYDDVKQLRQFFAEYVKGLGYKESSHFLRNIGIMGLAILDKHILRTMYEYDIIDIIPKSLNPKKYVEFENKYIEFANKTKINMDELDLLLWSMKNGEIMK
jgi:N-glycosylase/DNA lyase